MLGYWVAKRLVDGQLFAEMVAPPADVDPARIAHTGLPREALEQGVTLDELRRRWARFSRRDDIVVVWNRSTETLMRQLNGTASVNLKAAYRGFRQAQAQRGSLDEVVRAEGLACPPLPLLGRAGQRLAQAEAVARLLHGLGLDDHG